MSDEDGTEGGPVGPVVPETAFLERLGVLAVDDAVTRARCIWRETPTRDIGIDGQIEHLTAEGVGTGRIIAVQIKSGRSYFGRSTPHFVEYAPSQKHREYWAKFPIPVILVLHDPESDKTLWADARAALRDGRTSIVVPLEQKFDAQGVVRALELTGRLPVRDDGIEGLVSLMMKSKEGSLSFFDLFFQGLTDVAHSVYFGIDLVGEIYEAKARLAGAEYSEGIGASTFAFVDEYVSFLVAHDLARVDSDAWRRMLERFEMVGRFICPLTGRGEALVKLVAQLDEELGGREGYSSVVQESFVNMIPLGIDGRTARRERFSLEYLPKLGGPPSLVE